MIDIAKTVVDTLGGKNEVIEKKYEPGEMINGKPVRQWEKNVLARKLLGWEAKTILRGGIRKTASWVSYFILVHAKP